MFVYIFALSRLDCSSVHYYRLLSLFLLVVFLCYAGVANKYLNRMWARSSEYPMITLGQQCRERKVLIRCRKIVSYGAEVNMHGGCSTDWRQKLHRPVYRPRAAVVCYCYLQHTVWVKKSSLRFSDIFHKRLGIFSPNITSPYVTFQYPIYTRLQIFIHLQLWRSYAILSATTQFTSHAQNVHHRPKRRLGGRT